MSRETMLHRVGTAMVALLALVGSARGEQIGSNIEVLLAAAKSATDSILIAAPRADRATIRAGGVARTAVQERLLAKGLEVVDHAGDRRVLKIVVVDAMVTILETERRWFVGPRMARRVARVELSAKLHDGTGLTVWAGDAVAEADDWVPVSALETLAGPASSGCAPALPEEGWVRVAEPALVMASVAAVLYLFFSK
jgi:hypothetical protein